MSRLSGLYGETSLPSAMTAIAANTLESDTITIPGAKIGDFVWVSLAGLQATNAIISGSVVADDTVRFSIIAGGNSVSNTAGGTVRVKVVPVDNI